jgi:hypothetical protein
MIDVIPRAIGSAFEDQVMLVSYTDDVFGTMVRIIGRKGTVELLFSDATPTTILLYRFDDIYDIGYNVGHMVGPNWCEEFDLHDPGSIDEIKVHVDKIS